MGRQIVDGSPTEYIHFIWMRWIEAEGDASRHIAYNAWSKTTHQTVWNEIDGGGKQISQDGRRAGYCSMDVTSSGAAVVAFHEREPVSYLTKGSYDTWVPFGYFDDLITGAPGPPSCEGWVTGTYELTSYYSWPQVEWDLVAGDTVLHIVSTEWVQAPPEEAAGEIQTMVYYRKVNGEWPTCGTALDSVYSISAVVRSDTNTSRATDDVAIAWLKPMYYEGDPRDPCGNTWAQNDVVYIESTNGGVDWGPMINVTDYSQGQTLSTDQIEHQAYADLSAMYDSEGTFHIVWNTPLRDLTGDDPCAPLYASRVWHWDDSRGCISLIYDASRPRYHCDTGGWNVSTGKVNISQCVNTQTVPDSTRLYCSFTRFGAHTSEDGDENIDCSHPDSNGFMANGDLFLTGSSDGGLTWGPPADVPLYVDTSDANGEPASTGTALNLTNTYTPECHPDECLSEHWASMAKYSRDSVYILYVEDHDAGGAIQTEGIATENPVYFTLYECFHPSATCGLAATPEEMDIWIAPEGMEGCTVGETAQFDITLTNTGNQTVNYSAVVDSPWVNLAPTGGSIGAGCGNTASITCTVGPYATGGDYTVVIVITASCNGDEIIIVIVVNVTVTCYPPEYARLSTACWAIDVWNVPRAGGVGTEGEMFWFLDQIALMFDESLIITYADDTCQTWFSIFDGSDSNAGFMSIAPLTVASFGTYEYAHGLWTTPPDSDVVGEIEYYLPTHPDTCVLIQRIKICNDVDTTITISVGEAIDWDIPDGEGGSNNQCGVDESRQMVYQFGPPGTPEEEYYGGVSFCHDIPGAIVLENDEWVYPNSGYDPCQIGGLLVRHTGFEATNPDTAQDLNSVYAIGATDTRNPIVVLPGSCAVYCKVKASSLTGLEELQGFIDKGKMWISEHGLDCPGCDFICDAFIGDANGSNGPTPIDIDDVVYLIAYIFSEGPAPTPYEVASGDANSSCGVDIDDVVFLIAYIFSEGPAPLTCEEWVAACGGLQ
jgi:hypothetical protein